MVWTWEFMLQAFRGLGGKADNVAPKDGNPSDGLVPIDPQNTVQLYAPENLLFSIADVEFVDGRLKIRDKAKVGIAERTFFENYQESFSWGADGLSEATAFIRALDALPADVQALLSAEFAMRRLFEGGGYERAEDWFLESRRIGRRARGIMVPVLELVRHDATAAPYAEQGGLLLANRFAGEVRVLRGDVDSFGVFRRFGFVSPERVAFSMPFVYEGEGFQVAIGRSINFHSTMGAFPVPEYEIDGGSVALSCMMIGNSGFPRISRGIFQHIMREAGLPDADEIFDRVLHRNRMLFLKLLEVLEPYEGGLILMLRQMARYQLQAMSHCVGTREL